MKTYLVTYELTFSGYNPNYNELVNKIKSYQYWARPLKNVWLIKSESPREPIMDYLRPSLLFGDKLLVIEVTNDWISYNFSKEVIEWMQGGL